MNQKRTENWESDHERIMKLFEGPNPGRDVEEGKKVMKRAVKIREEILTTTVDIFKVHDIQVYCAPYLVYFLLVYWEIVGFTHGSISIDSDLFALGSKLLVDQLNLESSNGNCKIILRSAVMEKQLIAKDCEKWDYFEMFYIAYYVTVVFSIQ